MGKLTTGFTVSSQNIWSSVSDYFYTVQTGLVIGLHLDSLKQQLTFAL